MASMHNSRGPVASYGATSTITLERLTYHQRQDFYRRTFSHLAEPLHTLDIPELCTLHPSLAHEIAAAYLRHTTFTVKVWTNYDPIARRFYTDKTRMGDMGKLQLSPSQTRRLDALPFPLTFRRVIFEVGTPFVTLCSVKVIVRYNRRRNGSFLSCAWGSIPEKHPLIWDFFERTCEEQIPGLDLQGRRVLHLVDLRNIAAMFRFEPFPNEVRTKQLDLQQLQSIPESTRQFRFHPRSAWLFWEWEDDENPGAFSGAELRERGMRDGFH